MLRNFVDSTGQFARLTTFMKDIGTEKMERIEERLQARIDNEFPKERYDVKNDRKSIGILKGNELSHSKLGCFIVSSHSFDFSLYGLDVPLF